MIANAINQFSVFEVSNHKSNKWPDNPLYPILLLSVFADFGESFDLQKKKKI